MFHVSILHIIHYNLYYNLYHFNLILENNYSISNDYPSLIVQKIINCSNYKWLKLINWNSIENAEYFFRSNWTLSSVLIHRNKEDSYIQISNCSRYRGRHMPATYAVPVFKRTLTSISLFRHGSHAFRN